MRNAVETPEVEDVLVNVQGEVEEQREGLDEGVLGERVGGRGEGEVKDKQEIDGHCCDVQMLMNG